MNEVDNSLPDVEPVVGEVYNYGGPNYVVTRYDPESFLVLGATNEWTPAVGLTDAVDEGETATIDYVIAADQFAAFYVPGAIDEGASVDNTLPGDLPEVDNDLPEPDAEPKG